MKTARFTSEMTWLEDYLNRTLPADGDVTFALIQELVRQRDDAVRVLRNAVAAVPAAAGRDDFLDELDEMEAIAMLRLSRISEFARGGIFDELMKLNALSKRGERRSAQFETAQRLISAAGLGNLFDLHDDHPINDESDSRYMLVASSIQHQEVFGEPVSIQMEFTPLGVLCITTKVGLAQASIELRVVDDELKATQTISDSSLDDVDQNEMDATATMGDLADHVRRSVWFLQALSSYLVVKKTSGSTIAKQISGALIENARDAWYAIY